VLRTSSICISLFSDNSLTSIRGLMNISQMPRHRSCGMNGARHVLLHLPAKRVDVSQECNKEMLSTGELVPRFRVVTAFDNPALDQ
jgi:hypothetical protein